MSRTFYNKFYQSPRGMTLVELLVVVAIMLMLVAIGIPMLRPMLEKQGQSQGAQVLRVMLLRTRNLAIDKKIPFALRLERFNDVNSGDTEAVVRLSVVREPSAGAALSSAALNKPPLWVSVDGAGEPDFSGSFVNETEKVDAFYQDRYGVTHGTRIQFWGSGPVYRVEYTPDPPTALAHIRFINEAIAEINPPNPDSLLCDFPLGGGFAPFMVLAATPSWIPTSVPSILMPEGICVDLEYSGIGASGCEFGTVNTGDVLIWFRADGTLDRIDYGAGQSNKCDGTVHFLVGLWEQTSTVRAALSEDTRTNLEIPASIWVSFEPRSSRILVNEIKVPNTNIKEAREFAERLWEEFAAPR